MTEEMGKRELKGKIKSYLESERGHPLPQSPYPATLGVLESGRGSKRKYKIIFGV